MRSLTALTAPIVCDEAQDFRDEWWVALELLRSDPVSSALYVFYDDNQKLYARAKAFPIHDPPFSLTTNCRNTAKIHGAVYQFYAGGAVHPPEIAGQDVELLSHPTLHGQAGQLHSRIVGLITKEKIEPQDIVVLIADSALKVECYALLSCLPLPNPANWAEEDQRGPGMLVIDTVSRFKGLESAVIFAWGLDTLRLPEDQELCYVAMTRAKSLLVMVVCEKTCRAIQGSQTVIG